MRKKLLSGWGVIDNPRDISYALSTHKGGGGISRHAQSILYLLEIAKDHNIIIVNSLFTALEPKYTTTERERE